MVTSLFWVRESMVAVYHDCKGSQQNEQHKYKINDGEQDEAVKEYAWQQSQYGKRTGEQEDMVAFPGKRGSQRPQYSKQREKKPD